MQVCGPSLKLLQHSLNIHRNCKQPRGSREVGELQHLRFGEKALLEFLQDVKKIKFPKSELAELCDVTLDQLRGVIRDISSKGEEDVGVKPDTHIVPGYCTPTDKKLGVAHGLKLFLYFLMRITWTHCSPYRNLNLI